MTLEIAIGIGGTFTDVVCLQEQQRLFVAGFLCQADAAGHSLLHPTTR